MSKLRVSYRYHENEHVQIIFSTAIIDKADTNLVGGHCFTGEDSNILYPW